MRLASAALAFLATMQLVWEGLAVRRRHQRDLTNNLNSILAEVLPMASGEDEAANTPAPDYFKEYLSRGMFQCTSQYVETLTKLHELIKKAYDEYKRCERRKGLMAKSDQNPFDTLNKFIDQWQEEDAVKAGKDGRPAAKPGVADF